MGSEMCIRDRLNGPRGLALSPDSKYIYLADYGNNRVSKFTVDGEYILSWGKRGEGKGEFKEPSGIAVDKDENVYVADAWNSRIQKFDSNGKYLMEIGGVKASFYSPRNVAVDRYGILYVADTGTSRVHRFDTKGNRIGNPIGGIGKELGKFYEVFGIAFDSKDRVYVADCKNRRIVVLTSDLRPIRTIRVKAWEDVTPMWPMLAIDSRDYLYATSSGTQEIWIYDTKSPKFKYVGTLKVDTKGKPLFSDPLGITIDKYDNIYVSDTNVSKIIKLRPVFGR